MDIPNKKDVTLPDPVKRQPEGAPMLRLSAVIGWQIPTWIEDGLYKAEFKDDNHAVDMFNTLGSKIESLSATAEPEAAAVSFEYWRLPTPGAKKRKPIQLEATLYQHPDYDSYWLHLTYA